MTTMNVDMGQLRTAVKPYPDVKHLEVSTQFPHGMRIRVVEQLPVAALVAGGQTVAASPDGTLIHDAPTGSLPKVPVPAFPGGSRVTDPTALNALALLAATPEPLLAKISQVTTSAPHGLVAQLRNGPTIYFGTQPCCTRSGLRRPRCSPRRPRRARRTSTWRTRRDRPQASERRRCRRRVWRPPARRQAPTAVVVRRPRPPKPQPLPEEPNPRLELDP